MFSSYSAKRFGVAFVFFLVVKKCMVLVLQWFCSVLYAIFFISFFPLKLNPVKYERKRVSKSPQLLCFPGGKTSQFLKLVLKHEIIVLSNSCLVKTLL